MIWDDDRKVIDAATPGLWTVTQVYQEDQHDLSNLFGAWFRLAGGRTNQQAVCDAAFIACARTRWPAALNEIERLRKELFTIRAETTDALNDNYVSRNLVEHINKEVTVALQFEPESPMRTELRIEKDLFKAYRDGTLRALVLWEDRYARYVTGKILTLLEWDKFDNELTGNKTEVHITHILRADPHVDRDYVVISVQ